MLSTHEPELDSPSKRGSHERMCALTRDVKPTSELIRFVIGPEGIVPDLAHKLPGRGLWITATATALKEATARKIFARGYKKEVQVPQNLVETTERLLERDALNALSIARK